MRWETLGRAPAEMERDAGWSRSFLGAMVWGYHGAVVGGVLGAVVGGVLGA